MKVIEFHKKQMVWWKNKLGIDDYAVAWIAFIKGFIIYVDEFNFFKNYFTNHKKGNSIL